MQKELNSVTEHAASRAASANAELENVNEVHSWCLALIWVAVIAALYCWIWTKPKAPLKVAQCLNVHDLNSVVLIMAFQLEQQLKEARKEAQDTKLELCQALSQIDQMQKEKQLDLDQQAQLITSFNELKLEVEATKSSSQAYHLGAVDSAHALKSDIMNLQV
jgi:hypothetical protein